MFLDNHCHLEHEMLEKDFEEVVGKALRNKVTHAINAGSSISNNRKILELRKRRPEFLKVVLGTSPHDAQNCNLEEEVGFVEKNLHEIVGIGEIGLDYHHFSGEEERKRQQVVFESFLQLAEARDLPVQLHSRKAETRVLETLSKYRVRAVLHCFLVPEIWEKARKLGCIASLPTLKSKNRVKLIKSTALEELLCETDSPFLWKDGRNEPSNVVEVYEEIAAVKKIPLEEIAEAIRSNARSLYGF